MLVDNDKVSIHICNEEHLASGLLRLHAKHTSAAPVSSTVTCTSEIVQLT
jgi:hypothetical protein